VVVDLDAFAIQNQFELSSPGGDGTDAVALIDIGASVMKTNVIHAGACIFARDVPFGGNNYTDAIAQRLNVSTEMPRRPSKGGRSASTGTIWPSTRGVLPRAVARGATNLRLLRLDCGVGTDRQDRPVRRLCEADGLDDLPLVVWGVPVELARPFQGIEHDAASVPPTTTLSRSAPFWRWRSGSPSAARETSPHDQGQPRAPYDQETPPGGRQRPRAQSGPPVRRYPRGPRPDHRGWWLAMSLEQRRLSAEIDNNKRELARLQPIIAARPAVPAGA